MVSTLTVLLLDQVTRPAKKLTNSLLGISNAASTGGIRAGFGAKLDNAIRKNNRSLPQLRGRLTDAAAGIYPLGPLLQLLWQTQVNLKVYC